MQNNNTHMQVTQLYVALMQRAIQINSSTSFFVKNSNVVNIMLQHNVTLQQLQETYNLQLVNDNYYEDHIEIILSNK